MTFFNLITKKIASFSAISVLLLSFNFGTIPAFSQSDLVPDPCPASGCPITGDGLGVAASNVSREEIADIILFVANILTYIIGALAVLFIVIGALLMVVGRGEQGIKLVKNALIGLIIGILAYTVVYVVGSVAQGDFLGF